MLYIYARIRQDSEKEKLKEIIDNESNGMVDRRYKRKKDSTKDKFVRVLSLDLIVEICYKIIKL